MYIFYHKHYSLILIPNDEVVFTLANLFRSIGIEPVVEPVRLFDADPDLDDRRRPDILIRNPRGFDRQVLLDVAVTGTDLFGRVTYDDPYKPLEVMSLTL